MGLRDRLRKFTSAQALTHLSGLENNWIGSEMIQNKERLFGSDGVINKKMPRASM
jgi:hypothetical protein